MQAFLLAFAVREHLEITQEEADQQILQIAQRSHQDYNSLHNSICKSKLFHDLQLRLLAAKALNVLYKKVSKVVVDSRGNPVPAPERTEA